jgi:hypothetical protein
MRTQDSFDNISTDYSDTIIYSPDSISPTVSQAYISSWTTWTDLTYNYYKWTIDIRWDVSDNIWLNVWTCEYTTWAWWISSNYSWTSTTWYCYKTWLILTTDINLQFRIQDSTTNLTTWSVWAYLYDITPSSIPSFTINSWVLYINTTWVTLKIAICPADAWIWLDMVWYENNTWWSWIWTWCTSNKTIPRNLTIWDWIKTVYMVSKDKLWNISNRTWQSITLDSSPAQIFTGVIYSWSTWYSSPNYYYKWAIDIWSPVNDTVGISWTSCEYSTWIASRGAANYSWTTTAWYCYSTWLNYTSNITINFRVRDISNNLSTWIATAYLYDGISPIVIFTWSISWNNLTGITNSFTPQLQITETWIWLSQFIYTWNSIPYSVYDSGLVLMYNFDNVSVLWETWTMVKDASQYSNNWTTYTGAIWTGNWKYGWAYSFDWLSGRIISAPSNRSGNMTVSLWINKKWAVNTFAPLVEQGWTNAFRLILYNNTLCFWNDTVTDNFYCSAALTINLNTRYHITATYSWTNSIYLDWIPLSLSPNAGQYWYTSNNFLYIWDRDYTVAVDAFNGLIDEVRIYNRALSTWDVDLLYRSNLNKYSTWQWLFTDNRMCMLNWAYNYTWFALDSLSNNYSTWIKYNVLIPGYGLWYPWWINLWNVTPSASIQTLSWQFTWYFQIQDDIGTTWWYTTIQLPWSLPWTALSWVSNPSFSIDISNIEFRSNTWIISLVSWTPTTWVYISGGIVNYVNFTWSKQYMMRDKRNNPYSCPTGTYGNKPWIKINIPARQSPNIYSWTLTFDINSP